MYMYVMAIRNPVELREKIKVELIRHFININTQAIRIFGGGWQKWNMDKI